MINVNDYVIALNGKRPYLMKVLESTKTEVIGQVEKMCHISSLRTTATVTPDQVMLNLGLTPSPGRVYGVEVGSRFYGRKNHDNMGSINFFYKPSKQVNADLWLAFSKAHLILKKRGLEFLVEDVVWEILPFNGEKYCGMFIKAKNDKVPDRIQIRPEIMPASEYVYCILHELAHRLHLSYVKSKKINANWVKLFNTSIKVTDISKEVSKTLLDALLNQEDNPSNFKSQLGEDEALAYKWIIRTIRTNHSISIKELDLLFEADMKSEIKDLWPVRTISKKDLEPIVSEYSCKSYYELLAESLSFNLTGKKLPKIIEDLVANTISYAKANQNPTML